MRKQDWNPDWSFLRGSIALWLLTVGLPLIIITGIMILAF
jgi:hypothetical protein